MKIKVICLLLILLIPAIGFSQTLSDSVKSLIETNPAIQEKIDTFQAVKYDLEAAYSGYRPKVDVIGNYGYEKTNSAGTIFKDVELTRKELNLQFRQNLFQGYDTKFKIKREESRLDSAVYSIFEKTNSLALRSAEVYLNVLRQKELLELALENVQIHEKIYSKIKERTDSKVGIRSEFDQASGRLALAKSNIIVQEANYQDAISNFYRVIGSFPSVESMVKPSLSYGLPSSIEETTSKALELNPSLKVQTANIKSSQSNFELSKKNFYPKLDVVANKRWADDIDGIEGRNNRLNAMLELSFNLYNGGADTSECKKQIKLLSKEKNTLFDLQRRVEENARLAWTSYEMVSKQIKHLQEHKFYSKQSLDAYMEEFSVGKRSLLDILDTEGEYYRARRELSRADYDLLFAKYRVLESTGELLDAMNIKIVKK